MSISQKIQRQFDRIFLQHPREAGEPFMQHWLFTLYVTFYLLVTAGSTLVHGLCPCLCKTTTSDRINRLHALLQERRAACRTQTPISE